MQFRGRIQCGKPLFDFEEQIKLALPVISFCQQIEFE
jgi:hypothetical protein